MALEIAPAPAKAAPGKSTAQAAARTDSADRGSKPAGHGKSGQTADPVGFLALLMGLGQEPAPGASADATALASDAADPDAKNLNADLVAALPAALPITLLPDTAAMPAMALPGAHRTAANADGLSGDAVNTLALENTDKATLGRRRTPLQAGAASLTDTQQLQTITAQEPSAHTAKSADLAAARDGKPATATQSETQAVAISASLQAPVAGDEARNAAHGLQAKVEIADNLVLLSSGLSGAMSAGGGMTDVAASGSAAQFQSVVAQEVSFYVSQDVQSAEMKLEGVGGGPVEVSINMQGKEAQVVFRTDEIQTREMLEGATAQLKDMLQQQGVVLTGVFVGSSGAGDGGQQQGRRFRQGARSETTSRIVMPEVRGVGGAAAGVGRTLDLYV